MGLQDIEIACTRYGVRALCALVCLLGASCGRDVATPLAYVFAAPDGVRCEWWINGEPVTVTRSAVLMHQDGFVQDGSNTIMVVATGLSCEKAYLTVDVRRVTDVFDNGVVVASGGRIVPAGQTVTATMTFVAARHKTLPLQFYDDVTVLSDDDSNVLTMAVDRMIQGFANTNPAMFATLRGARLSKGATLYDQVIIAETNYGIDEIEKRIAKETEYSFIRTPLTNVAFLTGRKLVCVHADGRGLCEATFTMNGGEQFVFAPRTFLFLRYTGEWLRIVE